MIRQADKGGKMVIMDTSAYDQEIYALLQNKNIYEPIPSDPTQEIHRSIAFLIRDIESSGAMTDKIADSILTGGELKCPHFYGLPKIHKPNAPGHSLPSLGV